MKKIRLENRGTQDGAECSKWMEVVDDGKKVVASWGGIGAKGQSKVLVESDDAEVRQKAFDKKVKSKTQRKDNPYVVISENNDGRVQVREERPSADGRKFGLEVETHTGVDVDTVIRELAQRGLRIKDSRDRYFHSTGDTWDLKRDGSCGYEFASAILSGELGIFNSKLALENIRAVCPTAVNSNCGIHVTVDVSDHSPADMKRLMIAYLKAQEHFYALCAESRRTNRYCKMNPDHNLANMINTSPSSLKRILDYVADGDSNDHDSRYHGLNVTRYGSRKVIEFRMMEGSVAVRKVGGWIRTIINFIDNIKASGVTFSTAHKFSAETFEAILAGTWSVK